MKTGWVTKRLGEVCEILSDGDWIESKDQSSSGIRLIQTGNIGLGVFRNKDGNEHYVSEDTFKRLRCTEIFAGDILVSRLPDPVGRACEIPDVGERMITAVDCSIIRLRDTLCLPQWFVHYASSSQWFAKVEKKCKGSTRKRISRKNLAEIEIVFPPLAEQKRIVAKIDAAFEKIDRLKANAERNLANAKELFQSALNEAMRPKPGWVEKRLGEVCVLKSGNSRANSAPQGELPYVKVGDMTLPGNVDCITTSSRFVDRKFIGRDIFPAGAVIFPKRGGAILTNKKRLTAVDICCDLNIMGVSPKDGTVKSEYLYYYFLGIDFSKMCDGATIPQLNNCDIAPLKFCFPSVADQGKIVDCVNSMEVCLKRLQSNYTRLIADCAEMRQAVLKEAFEGRL